MLSLLTDFVQELRRAGVPVSMVEAIDAMEALRHVDLGNRAALKATLSATMVKSARHQPAFDTAFEVYFALRRPAGDEMTDEEPAVEGSPGSRGGGGAGALDLDRLIEMLFEALRSRDFEALRRGARQAVDQLAGMEPGRPVGGTYYLYRTLRQLDVEGLHQRLLQALGADDGELDDLERRLLAEEVGARIERLREEVREEIRRRLVEDRGHQAVARTLRQPLVEDLDLMHATRTDLLEIEHVIEPLTRKLAARLARRRRARRGRLDLSGSMATFARFTLQFTYAMATQFSRLRAFVFVDAVDEVTDYLKPGIDFKEALARISTEADVVWLDGHSDYGHALEVFVERYGRQLTPRSTVIITGDARNNYREPRPQHLATIAERAQAVYWLNPEPRAYWDSGDSVMSRYGRVCDEVFEVRNLRQLEAFVERVAGQTRHTPVRRIRSIGPMGVPMNGRQEALKPRG
jgi:uncharacterized protein with von Willebrand factor type A (vWA) domain